MEFSLSELTKMFNGNNIGKGEETTEELYEDSSDIDIINLTGDIQADYNSDEFVKSSSDEEKDADETTNSNNGNNPAIEKYMNNLFGDVSIPDNAEEYTGIAAISKAELNEKLGTNYKKSYASAATIEFAKGITGSNEVKYVDDKGKEHTINSKDDIKKYAQSVPENPQDIPVGSIVTMDNPKGGNFHSGILMGYTKDGKAIVMEANSDKANGGAAMVIYDFNSDNAKSIKGYIQIGNQQSETPEEQTAVDSPEKLDETAESAVETPEAVAEQPIVPEAEAIDNQPVLEVEEPQNAGVKTNTTAQEFINKVFGSSIQLEDLTEDEIVSDSKGHYIEAGSTTLKEFETNMGKTYGSKYASQAAIDMAKTMYGLSSDDVLQDTEGHKIESKEDIKKYAQDIPTVSEGEHPVPIGSMVICDDPKGGNFHPSIVVGYTKDGRAIVSEANSAKSKDGKGGALAVYSFNSNDEKSIKQFIPLSSKAYEEQAADILQETANEPAPLGNGKNIHNEQPAQTTLIETLNNNDALISNAKKYLDMSERQVEKATGKSYINGFYCAQFVETVLEETYGDNLPQWYKDCTGKATTRYVLAAAEEAGAVVYNPDDIQEGHQYLVVFNTKRGKATHIGFFKSRNGNTINTVEGNSTKGKVCERSYDKDKIIKGGKKRIEAYIMIA